MNKSILDRAKTLTELKKKFRYGLTPKGLKQLVEIAPKIMCCAKFRNKNGDSRIKRTAQQMLDTSNLLETTNLINGHFREIWILE